MAGILLAINHGYALTTAESHQRSQGDLGRIGAPGKHGFAKHHASNIHTIKPANKIAIPPDFNAVSVARPVQLGIGHDHFRNDPGSGLALAGYVGASSDHAAEGAVELKFTARRDEKALDGFF